MTEYFATCPRGLESILADELVAAGASRIRQIHGGVHFTGTWPVCYAVNLESRTATRVLWCITKAAYQREEDIYRLARSVAWFKYFNLTNTIRVLTTAIKSPLKSIDFVTLRIKDAICDGVEFTVLRVDRIARRTIV